MNKKTLTGFAVVGSLLTTPAQLGANHQTDDASHHQIEVTNQLPQDTTKIITYQERLATTLKMSENPILNTPIHQMSLKDIQSATLTAVNDLRAEHKLKKLKLLDCDVAQQHSQYLYDSDNDKTLEYLDHFGPNGESIEERVQESFKRVGNKWKLYDGYDYEPCAENIASVNWGTTVNRAMNAWLSSKGHREALLYEHWDAIAVGHAKGSNTIVLVFIKFAK